MDIEAFQEQWKQNLSSSAQSVIAEHGVKSKSAYRMDKLLNFWLQTSGKRAHLAREVKVDGYAVDFCLEFPERIILVEVDENQHLKYDQVNESARMMLVLQSLRRTLKGKNLGDNPVHIVRFNPHQFKVGQVKYDTPLVQREVLLVQHLERLFTEGDNAGTTTCLV